MTKARDIADGVDTADIADGAISTAKLADNSINATKLDVSGNGTAGQFLSSDGDGSMTWADAGGGFAYNAPTGTSQTWDIGSYNYFNMGTLSANTTVAFSNIPTEANWEFRVRGAGSSNAWDSTELVQVESINIQTIATAGGSSEYGQYGIYFKPDGTKMFATSSGRTSSYNLSTAWRLSTATYEQTLNHYAYENQSYGLFFKPDGTIMYVVGYDQDGVVEFALSTAWDISTATYTSFTDTELLAGRGNSNPQGLSFSTDGTKMYIVMAGSAPLEGLWEFSLSTAWDSSTASFTRNTDLSTTIGSNIYDHRFKSDGTKIFFSRASSPYLYEATLSTAWDTSTMGTPTATQTTGDSFTGRNLFISSDGSKFVRQSGSTVAMHYAITPYTLTLPTSVNVNGASSADNVLTPSLDYEYLYKCVTSNSGTSVTRYLVDAVSLF